MPFIDYSDLADADFPPRAPHVARDPFTTGRYCPNCQQELMDVTRENDVTPVLLCLSFSCIEDPLYTVEANQLVEWCPSCEVATYRCRCPKEG